MTAVPSLPLGRAAGSRCVLIVDVEAGVRDVAGFLNGVRAGSQPGRPLCLPRRPGVAAGQAADRGGQVGAALFFSALSAGSGPHPATAVPGSLLATERTLLVTLVMIAVAFALGWLLPRRARQMH